LLLAFFRAHENAFDDLVKKALVEEDKHWSARGH
jgi:hypothetical protein